MSSPPFALQQATCVHLGVLSQKTTQEGPTQLYGLKSHDWYKVLYVSFVAFVQLSCAHHLKICARA